MGYSVTVIAPVKEEPDHYCCKCEWLDAPLGCWKSVGSTCNPWPAPLDRKGAAELVTRLAAELKGL